MLPPRSFPHISSPQRRLSTRRRRAAATVELAVLLPIIFVIVLGSIESASAIFLRQALVQAAYEAAKVAVKTANPSQAESSALAVTRGRRIDQVRVEFEPSDLAIARRGEIIHVRVSAPGDSNTILPIGVFRGRMIGAEAVMVME
jgi:hypothetical protein